MKVVSMRIEAGEHLAHWTLVVKMQLESGGDYLWRSFEVPIPALPEDPVQAWDALRVHVFRLVPRPVNPDTSIRDMACRLPAAEAMVRP